MTGVAVQKDVAGLVEDAQVHASGVEVNAAVESVRWLIEGLFVEAHSGLVAMGVGAQARIVVGRCVLPENPTLGRRLGAEPAIPLGLVPRPSQRGHDEYQTAEADRAGITALRDLRSLQPARQLA